MEIDNDGFDQVGERVEVTAEEVRASLAGETVPELNSQTETEEEEEEVAEVEEVAVVENEEVEEVAESETEEEVNLFENLEPEKEPGDTNSTDLNLKSYSEKYGVGEVNSIEDLMEKIASKGQAPVFASDEIKSVFEQANQIHAAGGDFREVFDTDTRLKSAESKYKQSVETDGILKQYLESSDLEAKRTYLKHHYKEVMKFKGALLDNSMEAIEEMSDLDLATKANTLLLSDISSNSGIVSANQRLFEEAKSTQSGLVTESANRAAEAKKLIAKTINEFKDPDSSAFTSKTQSASQKAFGTKQSNYMMPEGVAELLFTTEGKIDMTKMMNLINLATNGKAKFDHLSKVAKQNYFRDLKGQKKKPASSKTSVTEQTSDDDGFGTVSYGQQRDANVEVLNG